MLWSSGWTALERPSSFTAPRSEFTRNVSTKGLNSELRVPVAWSLESPFKCVMLGSREAETPVSLLHPLGRRSGVGGGLSEVWVARGGRAEATLNQQSLQGVPVWVLVWVLANKQDLLDKELSAQEQARAMLTHVQGCKWLELQPDLEHIVR